ncbi:NucA/NucB deoxyribonuclease domain-containing protein [Nonomuraea salmonea]|uniref:NucA/NucB deoxyribonuclease domain-containing protein n=1 Tax=Nonomuraea salmonea TaxID=46181 RepID=UPI00406BB814
MPGVQLIQAGCRRGHRGPADRDRLARCLVSDCGKQRSYGPQGARPTSGERIPGSSDRIAQNPLRPTPLTRAWPGKNAGDVEHEIRRVVGRTCAERFGPKWYEANKEHCDEYPFASTLEGAANDDFDFSVKLIPECASCTADSTQSIFWMRYKVLPGDTFYVKIYDGQ